MKDNKNYIGHNFGKGNLISKEDLLKTLDVLSKEIKPGMTGYTQDMIKIIKSKEDNRVIVGSMVFSDLKLNNDVELFNLILKILNNYSKAISDLKNKIDEELPDTISTNSSNLNIKLAMSLINIGIFLGYTLPTTYSYLMTRYYIKSEDIKSDIYKSVPGSLGTVVSMLKDFKKLNFDDLIDMIGKFPTLRNISSNKSSLPSQVVLGFMKSDLGVTSKIITSYITKAFNLLKKDRIHSKRTVQSLKDRVGPSGFIGNPIYHIKLFLTDIELWNYDRIKDNKRLLELKIAKLKINSIHTTDSEEKSKLDTQIEYYTEKVERLELKLHTVVDENDSRTRVR
jgi:hypothetical protein